MPTTRDHPVCDIASHFSAVDDPREAKGKQHRLDESMAIAICAVICGAEGFAAIEGFGRAKQDWLSRFLTLKHGIPSHDTIGRVFARIAPEEFERCFLRVGALCLRSDRRRGGRHLRRKDAPALLRPPLGQGSLAYGRLPCIW